jgi:pimeloyl-ACP methyl ester carboxylesterase
MGGTPGPDWLVEWEGYVDWVAAFVDATIGPGRPFALAGSSFGGWVALRLLERDPDRVDGLLLSVPAVHLNPANRRRPPRRVLVPADDALLSDVAEDEQGWRAVGVVQTAETLDGFRRGTKLGVQAADHAFLDGLDPALERAQPGGRLAAPFDRPALILAGRQDHLAGYADAVDLLESFPRATLAVLDRAGHGVPNEQRGLFRALVGEWLDRVAEARPG